MTYPLTKSKDIIKEKQYRIGDEEEQEWNEMRRNSAQRNKRSSAGPSR